MNSRKKALRVAGLAWSPLAVVAAALFSSSPANAHFTLEAPADWIEATDPLGDPQKAGPCGTDSQTPGTPTGKVTTFVAGETIQLHFTETIPHDGWYRISLSYADRADLTDPAYQTDPVTGNSLDASIENPVVAPVLLDGVFWHLASQTQVPKAYTQALTLPMRTCTKCTLQIEEIMLNHPVNQADGKYTYHHCADISIVAAGEGGVSTVDGGVVTTTDAGASTEKADSGSVKGTGKDGGSSEDHDSGASDDDGSDGTSSDDSSSGSSSSSGGSSGGCTVTGGGATSAAGGAFAVIAIALGIRRRNARKH